MKKLRWRKKGGNCMDDKKARAAAWIATGIAVAVGVYVTKSAWCMWALLLPATY